MTAALQQAVQITLQGRIRTLSKRHRLTRKWMWLDQRGLDGLISGMREEYTAVLSTSSSFMRLVALLYASKSTFEQTSSWKICLRSTLIRVCLLRGESPVSPLYPRRSFEGSFSLCGTEHSSSSDTRIYWMSIQVPSVLKHRVSGWACRYTDELLAVPGWYRLIK